ncbi:MAG: polysaccharide biosynthesis C-terminal domain-containing protein [Myxococcota bacterium]
MKEDVRTLARGGGLLLAATLVGNALLLLLDGYVNGVLGLEGYGLYGALKRVLQLAGFAVALGMENAVVRFVATARTPEEADGAVQRAALATVAASVVAAVAIAVVLPRLYPAGVEAARVGALSLPLASIRLVAVSASNGWKDVRPRAVVMFVAWPIAQLVGVGVLAHALGLGVVGVMWAYVGAMAIGAALAVAMLLRARPRVASPAPGSLTALLAFSWPMWVQGMLMAAYTWADQVLLVGIRGPADGGVYGPVATLAPLFGLGLGALNGQLAPMIAERHAAGDVAAMERLYRTVARWAVVFAVPPLAVCVAVPEAVLQLWPNGSAEAATALRVTCAAQLACTAVGSVNYMLIMAGRQRETLINGVPALGLNLALSFALMPRYGVTGAALANGIAMATANGVGCWQVWRALGVHPFDRALLKPILAGVPAAAAATLAIGLPRYLDVVAGAALALVTFGVVLRALGLDADDRGVIDAIARKVRR